MSNENDIRIPVEFEQIASSLSGGRFCSGACGGITYNEASGFFLSGLSREVLNFILPRLTMRGKASFAWWIMLSWLTRARVKNNETFALKLSLNGFVLVDFGREEIIKVISPLVAEPLFPENEIAVSQNLGDFVPRLIDTGKLNGMYSFARWNFSREAVPLRSSRWKEIAPDVLSILKQHYKLSGIQSGGWTEYMEWLNVLWAADGTLALKQMEDGAVLHGSFMKILEKVRERYPDVRLYKTLSHGDLSPGNVLERRNEGLLICDWSMGGRYNIFYDLAVQDMYKPDSPLWSGLFMIERNDFKDERVLNGWGCEYLGMCESLLEREFSIEDIRVGLFLSVLEKLSGTLRRYSLDVSGHYRSSDILNRLRKIESDVTKSFMG